MIPKHRVAAAAVALAIAGGGPTILAAPAGAAPPAISCSGYYPEEDIQEITGWCVTSDGITISAGMKNLGSSYHSFADGGWSPGRVKLVGFPDTGGIVELGASAWSHSLPAGHVLTTPPVAWWVAGTVCSQREVLRGGTHHETRLMHCVRN